MTAKMQLQDGKVKWKKFKMSASYKELLGIDVEPIDSSGKFSQDLRRCRLFKKSGMICENETLNLKNSQTRSSSCQCSAISIGQAKETMEFVFRIQTMLRNT